ncbi:MAG: tetratricopeptide repeat protein [bacterium]
MFKIAKSLIYPVFVPTSIITFKIMNLRCTFIFCIVCIILSSCAYFNTFYNTKKLYNEAKKEREKRKGDKPSPQELKKYDDTIKKASKILEIYPKSKYVDDAVMILGECFYYKGNYVKSQRKFQELITYFPNSKYFDRAKLWFAKTNIKLNDYLGAKLNLLELQNLQKIERDVVDESRLLLGDIHFEQGDYEQAENEYKEAAIRANKKEMRAKAYFQMGQCQLKTQKYFEAIESFKMALKHDQDKQFKFEAELNLGRALKLAGGYENSTKICMDLLENQSYKDKHGLVKLEIADCLYREGKTLYRKLKEADVNYLGKIDEALDEYKKITTEYKKTEVSATAYFQMAKIYEEDFGDFTQAKENYEKVRSEFNRSKLVELANQKARNLGKLIILKNLVDKSQGIRSNGSSVKTHQLTEMERLLLEQGVHPELRFLRKKRKLATLTQASKSPTKSLEEANENEKNTQSYDVDEIVVSKLQLAELYLYQFAQFDSAITEYKEILELFPNHSAAAKALYSMAFIYENEYQDKVLTDSLLLELVKKYPASYQAQEARKKLGLPSVFVQSDQPEVLYKRAEQTLFNEKNIQKAIEEFQKIIDRYPNSQYAPKSLYAIGWIYEQMMHQNDRAYEIYQEIVNKYPNTDFSKKVKKKIDAVQKLLSEEDRKNEEAMEEP